MERMNLETVWSGSHWRSYPQPVVAQPVSREEPPETSMARLLEVLTDQWQARAAIQDRTTMAPARVREYLQRLIDQGRVERLTHPAHTKAHRGRPQHFYRRRAQARTEAA